MSYANNNFGLNASYQYMEFEFDSADANIQHIGTATTLNWPHFELARPLSIYTYKSNVYSQRRFN